MNVRHFKPIKILRIQKKMSATNDFFFGSSVASKKEGKVMSDENILFILVFIINNIHLSNSNLGVLGFWGFGV